MLLHVSKHFQGFLVNILYVCVCSSAQLCLTPDSLDCSPPGSNVHGIFQARILWSGFPFPILDYLPNPGIKPTSLASPALAGRFFTTLPPGKPGAYIWVSVQLSRSVVSNSLHPHGLQPTRPPCPSPTPRVCSNSRPSSW